MGRKQILFLLILCFPVLVTFNNCSRSRGLADGGSLDSSSFLSGSGGNGFVGKAQFEFYQLNPGCDAERGQASQTITMDWGLSQASIDSSTCDSVWSGSINFADVLDNGYNSYVLSYQQRLFVTPLLHEGVPGHVYYKEFCFNEVIQEDFIIQYIEEVLPGKSELNLKWTGIILYGPQASLPGILFNGGFLETRDDGSKLFSTHNETYRVEIDSPRGDGTSKARLIKRDATVVPMNCWNQSEDHF